MKNKLTDLNDHLFAQLERLADEALTPAQVDQEAKRGKAMVAVADQIIKNAGLQVQVARLIAEKGNARSHLPGVLGGQLEPARPKLIGAENK